MRIDAQTEFLTTIRLAVVTAVADLEQDVARGSYSGVSTGRSLGTFNNILEVIDAYTQARPKRVSGLEENLRLAKSHPG